MIRITAILPLLFALSSAPAGALTFTEGAQWPDGDIRVCWEAPIREHAQERDLIRKAVAWTWEKESAVRFSGWQACRDDSKGVRIALETKFPQTHGRGKELDGKAKGMVLPSLWSLAALSINLKAPVHEFGHALGFGHEYARPDAPDLARCSPRSETGAPYVENDIPLTSFDRDSIMVGCILGATVRFSRGTPKLSAADIFGLVSVYGSNPANVLDIDEAGDGFGSAIALKDLNGDETLDLLVSAPGEDGGKGALYLFLGDALSGFRPSAKLPAAHFASENLRWSGPDSKGLPASGDLQTLLTRSAARADPAIRRLFPGLSGDSTIGMNALEHDLDSDGLPDLIVGAPNATPSGAVIVFRGLPSGESGRKLQAWYWFGQAY